MALEWTRQEFEAEDLIGAESAQVLLRAEALVPGAGREAIEPLMTDASLFIDAVDLQADRLVLEGTVSCQAVYRQGGESTLRALAAKARLDHALEIPGAEPGMFSRVHGAVEHVEARYENGHMIFLVICGLRAKVLQLRQVSCIRSVSEREGLETAFRQLSSVKLAAEASETALLRETVVLPAELDARATLMDWAVAEVDEVAPDLGGVRVKGRVLVESLLSSGAAPVPAAVVRVPMALDQLVELPEWLSANVAAELDVRGLRTQISMAADGVTAQLSCEAELRARVLASTVDAPKALVDAYATRGSALEIQRQPVRLCASVDRAQLTETARGAVPVEDGAPRVGTVIAVQARPVVSQWHGDGSGAGRVEGVLEVEVLYAPAGGGQPTSASSELPFAVDVPIGLNNDSTVFVQTLSAEASALLGDRLDVKAQLNVRCETRQRQTVDIVTDIREGEPVRRRPGVVIVWPEAGEDAWSLGRRYAIPAEQAAGASPGQPLVLKL